jgi:hypothetical protein
MSIDVRARVVLRPCVRAVGLAVGEADGLPVGPAVGAAEGDACQEKEGATKACVREFEVRSPKPFWSFLFCNARCTTNWQYPFMSPGL